jgi:hypothetical protein
VTKTEVEAMLENVKPGQTIRCTVTRDVHRDADAKTICRLMRQDPDVKRRLKQTQEHRMQNLVVRSRGKRPWAVREKATKAVRAAKGQTWEMTYIPHLRDDMLAVERYLDVNPA